MSLLDDFGIVSGTGFWTAYQDRLAKLKADLTESLASISPDELAKVQGEIFALKLALGLPDRLIQETKEKKS